ncbi:MAG: hypothetical protein OEO20_11425 [Gemmatimonadota bacterium]|nr:hypothetical protein [Gemmatimonadota bacterium]MDH3366515.1 hypothetical protein [Gemmatimonadota bacterium]MDH3478904.1 hypothetical protein [Gemmatimonadota bacterium]MDH3571817.1 hypothetical protein [Gemmatimonadota bacterium]
MPRGSAVLAGSGPGAEPVLFGELLPGNWARLVGVLEREGLELTVQPARDVVTIGTPDGSVVSVDGAALRVAARHGDGAVLAVLDRVADYLEAARDAVQRCERAGQLAAVRDGGGEA